MPSMQLADAMRYMHSHIPLLIHRDLKLENVLLTRGPRGQLVVKLCDFGLVVVSQSVNIYRAVAGRLASCWAVSDGYLWGVGS